MNSSFYLREVQEKDKQLLLEWANDKDVRNNAFNTSMISPEDHEKWFCKALKNPSIVIYILMSNDTPIGQCRLTVENGEADIDYSIDGKMRGKGIGSILLKLVEQEVKSSHKEIRKLVGRVKTSNEASKKCFKSNNYYDSYCVFEKEIQ